MCVYIYIIIYAHTYLMRIHWIDKKYSINVNVACWCVVYAQTIHVLNVACDVIRDICLLHILYIYVCVCVYNVCIYTSHLYTHNF